MASQSSAATSTAVCALSLLAVGGATWLYFRNSSSRRGGTAAREEWSIDDDIGDDNENEIEDSGDDLSAAAAVSFPALRARPLAASHPSASLRALRDVLLPPPCALPPRCEPALVETLEELRAVAGGPLARASVVGVDVEHSSRASYLGKVCTIQLSCAVVAAAEKEKRGNGEEVLLLETLAETFVVDVVEVCRRENETRRAKKFSLFFARGPPAPPPPEDQIADLLSPCFSDSRVLKVFHNGSSDLLWLQRDFPRLWAAGAASGGGGAKAAAAAGRGISPVADTARLARALGLRSDGLPAVLEFAADEAAALAAAVRGSSSGDDEIAASALRAAAEAAAENKAAAQRGDWLARPLSAPMLLYAAHDAHYLPFAAFLMSRRLEQKDAEGGDGEEGEEDEEKNKETKKARESGFDTSASAAVARESLAAAWAVSYRPSPSEAAARAAARRIIARSAAETSPSRASPLPLRGAFADAALALCRWRDAAARELDVPPREVLPDESVAALAGLTGAHGGAGWEEEEEEEDGEGAATGGSAAAALVVAVAERAVAAAAAAPSSLLLPHLRARAGAAAAAIDEALQGLHRWEEGESKVAASADGGDRDDSALDDGDDPGKKRPKPKTRLGRAIERFAAKGPVYHSCRLLSSDGALLAFVDRKKLRWYLHKGLAEVAEEETDSDGEEEAEEEEKEEAGAASETSPPKRKKKRVSAARLLFEHARFGGATTAQEAAAKAEAAATATATAAATATATAAATATATVSPPCHALLPDLFSASPRENRCVGCGERGHFLRYRVLPGCYRAALPPRLKAHAAHDVVLLCVPCHERAMAGAHALKRRLAAELGAPLEGGEGSAGSWRAGKLGVPSGDRGAAAAARTAAVTLARHGERMPAERRLELERVVWAAIRSDDGEEGGGGKDEDKDGNVDGEEGGGGKDEDKDGNVNGGKAPPPPPLPPKEVLAARLVAASSASGLIRRDAQRLCRALGVTLKGEDEEEEEGGEEEEGESSSEGEDDGKLSKKKRRPRRAAPLLFSSLPGRRTGGGHRAHGLAVVRALAASTGEKNGESENGDVEPALDALAARFRRAFVAAVAPRFLPPGWSVDAPLGRRAHGPYSAVVRAEEEARERSAAEARERRARRKEGGEAQVEEVIAAFAF